MFFSMAWVFFSLSWGILENITDDKMKKILLSEALWIITVREWSFNNSLPLALYKSGQSNEIVLLMMEKLGKNPSKIRSMRVSMQNFKPWRICPYHEWKPSPVFLHWYKYVLFREYI